MKTRTHSLVATLAAVALPLSAAAALTLGQSSGYIKGDGSTPSHGFPVVATKYTVEIGATDTSGFRLITVTVPVDEITTDNFMRDVHMRSAIFGAGKDKGIEEVVFTARTDQPVQPGSLDLAGELNVNGKSLPNKIRLAVSGDQTLTIQGQAKVSLSAYGIDAPGMGPMEVADTVSLEFSVKVPRDQLDAGKPIAQAIDLER